MNLSEKHKINVIYFSIRIYDYKSMICTGERDKEIKFVI